MSRIALSLALLALPAAALAQDPLAGESNDEVVTFEVNDRLFPGEQYRIGADLTESGPGLWFVVDVNTDLDIIMEGLSILEWPEILDNSWDQTERGGTLTLGSRGEAKLEINGTVAGIDLAYTIWSEEVRWVETFELRSLLLEGTRQGRSISLTPQGDALFDFEREFEVVEDNAFITVGAAIRPYLSAVVTGDTIEVDDGLLIGSVSKTREITMVEPPAVNDGFTPLDARWLGQFAGVMGMRTVPTVSVKVGSTTIGPVSVPLDLDLFDDSKKIASSWSPYSHDLPKAVAGATTLDFGQVVMGDKSTREFTLTNEGNVELIGVVSVEGEGFAVPNTNLLLPRTNDGAPTSQSFDIDLLPTQAGNYAGTLTILTNDPVNPVLTIPMAGVSIDPADPENPGGDPNDPGNGDGLVTQDGSGCGCSAVSPVSGLGGLAILGLFGLVARRRRS